MKPILSRLFAGLFLLLAAQVFGQAPSMTTNFVITSPATPSPYAIGTKIVIELRVTNFTNIESIQFPITYNKDAMKFDSLSEPAFSNWSAGNFVSVPAAGKIGISWDGYSNGANMPFSFPNGTAIFKLNFTVTGNGLSTINISPAAAPPAIDIVGNGTPGTINYQSGGTPTITLGTGNPPPPPLVGFKIIANNIYIPQGQRGCMPVTVNDFDNMVSMQWAMHWDNTVLNFECTRRHNLDGWSAGDFNSVFSPGTLLAGWSDPAGTGKSWPDGTRIVDVCFKAVGAPGANTTVTIDGVGMPPTSGTAEAFNSSSVNVWTTGGVNGASGVSAPINVFAQPAAAFDVTYNVDTIKVAPGAQGCVAVKVKNFSAVTSSEFALSYNSTQLSYVSTQFGVNPLNLVAANVSPAAGVVKFLWNNANGASVTNDSAIFRACFNVIATVPVGTISNINFSTTVCPGITGMGTTKSFGGVPFNSNNGWIKVGTNGPTLTPTAVACNGGSTGSIALDNPPATVATGYLWSNGATTEDITGGLIAGTYTVTVTYSGGTTATASASVTQLPAVSQTNAVTTVPCFGGNNGAINLTPAGGQSPYTFKWDNSAMSTTEDISGLTVGFYAVTITDAKSCTHVANIAVSGFSEMKLAANNPLVTPVTCAGLSNGAIEINLTGGAGNYTYDWSHNGPQTPDTDPRVLSGMAAGAYTVTVTDANSCTKVFSGANFTITAPQPIVSSLASDTDVKCFNSATGSATLTVSGGTGAYTYCWNTGGTACASMDQNPTNLSAGTYTAIITDAKGCTSTVSNVNIANAPSQLTVTGTTTASPCFEQSSGGVCVTPGGGWGNYTYNWAGPVSVPAIACPSGIPGGLYTVTVTDGGQCTATQNFTVAGSPAIASNTVVQNVTCFGTNNGGINLQLSGGNPQYQVAWSGTSLTGQSIGNLAPGNYQPTVTDMQGCTKVFAAITVTGPSELLVDETITEANPNDGAIDIEISQGGTPTFTYLWSTGATTQDIAGLNVGEYTVVIKDANACERTFTYSVPSGNVVGDPQVTSTKSACSEDGCIFLSLPQTAAGFMPVTLNWGFGSKQTTSLTPSICDLKAGLYNITVTAANGNSAVLTAVQVGQSDPASVNSNTTNPFSSITKNGKITLNKTSNVVCNLQYQWGPLPLNSTSNEVSNLGQGTYFVTITNPCSGCVTIDTFDLEYSPLGGVIDKKDPKCASVADGYVHINIQGGFLPYVYQWEGPNGFSSINEDIDDLVPGVYSLTVTDQDNRQYNEIFTLTSQSNLNITNVNETSQYGPTQVSGATICDGAANVVFIPGIGNSNILWSNGITTVNNTSLCGGAYSVTVTDGAGCSSVWTDELSAPAAITSITDPVGVKCHDDCDGSAKVVVNGGVAPYSVRWSTTQFDPTVFAGGFSQAVNLCGGDYQVTITDKNGVTVVTTVTVPEPPAIEVDFSPTAPRNFNACDGDLLANVIGATAPITYVWSGSFGHSGDTERAEELCSGEFVQYYITDANGCTAYATDSVPYPEDGCFRVSPVITPGQQDGKNDFVVITCIETASENHVEIYNRWGQLVFETDNYTNDDTNTEQNWNGLTNSGAALAEGVYYYVLTYSYTDDLGKKHDETRKGAINLLR